MENKKLIKSFLLVILLIFSLGPYKVFAYGTETHAALTQEIAKFYNQYFPEKKLTNSEILLLMDGSRQEDNPPRWMNHFYDPVNNSGLHFGGIVWYSSKEWAQNQDAQISALYNPAINSTLATFYAIADPKQLIATDFTWQRAIQDYVSGDKERSLKALGHILHLLEDITVPAHTRDDPHPDIEVLGYDFGNPDSYEVWTKKFTPENLNLSDKIKTKKLVNLDDINSYFNQLASYTNSHFYSDDRIGTTWYPAPIPLPEESVIIGDFRYNVNRDEEGIYNLSAQPKPTSIFSSINGIITLTPEGNDLVLQDYWSLLSTKAVQYGAGVINLFFQEAEAAKNKQNTTQSKSLFSQAIDAVSSAVSSLWSGILGIFGNDDNQNFQSAGQVSLDESTQMQIQTTTQQTNSPTNPATQTTQTTPVSTRASAAKQQQTNLDPTQTDDTQDENLQDQQTSDPQLDEQQIIQQTQNIPAANQCSFTTSQSPSHQGIIINEIAWMGSAADANDEWIELKNISNADIDITNWQLIDKAEQIKINLVSVNGTTVIKPGQFILLERTDDNSVPNITADLIYTGALSNTDEGLRLFDGQCNLIDEALANPSWPAGNNSSAAERKTMERDASGFNWHTSTIINGTPKKENSISIYSGGGSGDPVSNQSQNTNNQTQQSAATKILINEIQITGGAGKTDNDFIELYNPNNFAVNLNGYRLVKRTKIGTSDASIKSWTADAIIPAYGYYLWANSNYTNISTVPDITTTATISSDNSVAIRFGSENTGAVIDSVAWGQAQNIFIEGSVFPTNPGANQSIQRKFQNNTFVDTDNNAQDFEIQTCPSPKAQTQTCQTGQSDQALGAFFVYSPEGPAVGDLINFDASSSSLASSQITSYQWDFGDGATFSSASSTTSHSYLNVGDYSCQLTVFSNDNSSSTASEIISVASSSIISQEANHIVISEIMAGANNSANEEFVELYNPTDSAISLDGWYLKRKATPTSEEENLVSKTSSAFNGKTIAPSGFFLVASNQYSGSKTPDVRYSQNSVFLAENGDVILLYNNNGEIVDEIEYGAIDKDRSLERKAFYNNNCVAAQDSGEFLGNACEADYFSAEGGPASGWDIRQAPNPQNSLSLPEPRTAPTTPENFAVQYDSSAMKLNFNWQPSQDYNGATSTLIYKITDTSAASIILTTATPIAFSTVITEIGRDYSFSLQAFDKDALNSTIATSTISVPSFLSNLYFYSDPRASSTNYLIEAYYNQYPFVPDLYYASQNNTWKLLVFYLNSEPENQLNIDTLPYQPNNLQNVLSIKYNHCASGSLTTENSLLLPDIASRCGNEGGVQNIGFNFSELEDNHFIIQAASSSQDLTLNGNDFIAAAFYSTSYINVGPVPYFQLVAVDKTKYHFSQPPVHQPPQLTGQINWNFDAGSSRLYLDWPKATDPDTLDYLLTYEIKYNDLDLWQTLDNSTGTSRIVSAGDNFSISLRAKDDFDNYSAPALTANWLYGQTNFYVTQTTATNWSGQFGYKDSISNAYVNVQNITPQNDFQFNKVVLRIRQSQANDYANLKLSLYPDNNNFPDFSNELASATLSDVFNPDENQDMTFSFNSSVSVVNNQKYWFVLEVQSYSGFNTWNQWDRNAWQNAITENNDYLYGEAGGLVKNWDGTYSNITISNPNADWYMKIGLGQ